MKFVFHTNLPATLQLIIFISSLKKCFAQVQCQGFSSWLPSDTLMPFTSTEFTKDFTLCRRHAECVPSSYVQPQWFKIIANHQCCPIAKFRHLEMLSKSHPSHPRTTLPTALFAFVVYVVWKIRRSFLTDGFLFR